MTYQHLIDSIPTTRLTDLRDKVGLTLMLRCGLTVSEVCDLETVDVGNVLHISLPRPRAVPIPDDILPILSEWHKRRPESLWWLCTSQGTRVAPQWYRKLLHGLGESAGVSCSPIDLRHACGREWLKEYSVDEVVRLMGYGSRTALMKGLKVSLAHGR